MRTDPLPMLAAVTLGGRSTHTRIVPRDAPGQSGATTVQVGSRTHSDCRTVTGASGRPQQECTPQTTALQQSTAHIARTDDGRTAEFNGSVDLRITPNLGTPVLFGHPTLARLDGGDHVFVAGAKHADTRFPVEGTTVEVRQVHPLSGVLYGVASDALGVLVAFVVLSPGMVLP